MAVRPVRRYPSADLMLHSALRDVMDGGHERGPRGHDTIELFGWQGSLMDPRRRLVRNPDRDLRLGYAAAHVAWNLAKRDDVESICWWNPNGRFISDDGVRFHGANYGERWDGYLQEAMRLVSQDGTRRAWVPIWHPDDLVKRRMIDSYDMFDAPLETFYSRDGKDVPCTLGFDLQRHDGKLTMQVVMRSQSLTIMPYDVFLFATMQELVANTLGLELGELQWTALSLHAYFRREHAVHESTLAWYERALSGSKRDASDFRLVTTTMDPLGLTLDEAAQRWPQFEERVRTGAMSESEAVDLDPIERLMWERRPRDQTKP